jgi:hypothetical protein
MASFGEVLAEFKKNEAPEGIFPLLNDVPLCNALLAWKSVRINYKAQATEDCPLKEEYALWSWLWSVVEYDCQHFGTVAGCKYQESGTLLARLIGLRLIYPDGSINNYANQYIKKVILEKLNGGKKKKEKEG